MFKATSAIFERTKIKTALSLAKPRNRKESKLDRKDLITKRLNQVGAKRSKQELRRLLWIETNSFTNFCKNDPGTAPGPHFINGSKVNPFPRNPLYRPSRPLSNETKNEIYTTWTRDPVTWTSMKLGEHFGISIIRVEAILKMKIIENKWKQDNIVIMDDLATNMDRLLASQTRKCSETVDPEPMEKLRPILTDRIRPFFEMLSETESFTPEDAARLLSKNPLMQKIKKLDKNAEKAFSVEPPNSSSGFEIIRNDPKVTSTTDWMISNPATGEMTIREKNGLYRTATSLEKWFKRNRKPEYRHSKH